MNCPKCENKMEKGILAGNGAAWLKEGVGSKIQQIFLTDKVYAWRCPKCGKVELYTEMKSGQ